jgi:thiol-disulfide isomerase/thioredoxin
MDEADHQLPPERSRSLRFWGWLAVLAAVCLLWLAIPARQLKMQEPLGELSLRPLTFDGDALTLDDLKGKVVVLNFWGTWCPPCRQELPHIVELAHKFESDSRCRVLAVSCGSAGLDPADSLLELAMDTKHLLRKTRLDLPTYADPNGITRMAVKDAIGFSGYPTTVLLDGQGNIRQHWTGYSPGMELEIESMVKELLPAS